MASVRDMASYGVNTKPKTKSMPFKKKIFFLAFFILWYYFKAKRQIQKHTDLVITQKVKVICTAVV